MADLLYVDSSTLLTLLLGQHGHETVRAQLRAARLQGQECVSSKLLWLEARRVAVRELIGGNDLRSTTEAHLATVTQLPVNEDVWERAGRIEQHVRTLDAIHVATCELVGATLLTASVDGDIRKVAVARGIPIA